MFLLVCHIDIKLIQTAARHLIPDLSTIVIFAAKQNEE